MTKRICKNGILIIKSIEIKVERFHSKLRGVNIYYDSINAQLV